MQSIETTTTEDAGCPACEMSGWTPERAEREAPLYMAALRSVPSHPIPDEPAVECWDCRRLRAGGHDPQALALADAAERPHPPPTDGRPRMAALTGMAAIDLAERLGVELGSMHDRIAPSMRPEEARRMIAAEPNLAPALTVHVVEDDAATEYAAAQIASFARTMIAGALSRLEARGEIRGLIGAILRGAGCPEALLVTEQIVDALAGAAGQPHVN